MCWPRPVRVCLQRRQNRGAGVQTRQYVGQRHTNLDRAGAGFAVRPAGLEVLQQHVALHGQPAHHVLPLAARKVHHHGLLVAVGTHGRLAGGVARSVLYERRPPSARVVARLRTFDFDHLRTQIAHRLRRPRPCQHAQQTWIMHHSVQRYVFRISRVRGKLISDLSPCSPLILKTLKALRITIT